MRHKSNEDAFSTFVGIMEGLIAGGLILAATCFGVSIASDQFQQEDIARGAAYFTLVSIGVTALCVFVLGVAHRLRSGE